MADVLGKYSFLETPDVNGVDVLLNAGSTPTVQAGTFAARPVFGVAGRLYVDTTNNLWYRDTGAAWATIGSSGSSSPGAPVDSIQFNNAGSFGGSSSMTWNSTSSYLLINNTTSDLNLAVGGVADPATSTVYIEVATGASEIEAQRVYFNRGSAAVSAWITNSYDGNSPRIRLIDGDDDAPYIRFDTVGTGSFATPQFRNAFGGRGSPSNATTGFKWEVNGADIASIDTQFLELPGGTTAQRPTPVNGMTRYNTTLSRFEYYSAPNWLTTAQILDKTTTNAVITTAGPTNTYTYTVLGGTLGTQGILKLTLAGLWANASGANRAVTIAVSYGGTTMWSDSSNNLFSGQDVGFYIELVLCANNSVTSQSLNGVIHLGGTGVAATGQTGDLVSDEILANTILTGNNASANSANNQSFNVTVTFNGTGITWTKFYHILELI
jgi:hypothetical protein